MTQDRILSSILFSPPGYSNILSINKLNRMALDQSESPSWDAVMSSLPRYVPSEFE